MLRQAADSETRELLLPSLQQALEGRLLSDIPLFTIHRHSMAKRMRATLRAIKAKLRKRMHRPLGKTARWLHRVVQGWLNHHAVPGNSNRIGRFVDEVTRLWLCVIRRRSQLGRSRLRPGGVSPPGTPW